VRTAEHYHLDFVGSSVSLNLDFHASISQLERTFDLGTLSVQWIPGTVPPVEANGQVNVYLPTQTARAFLRLRKLD